MATQVVMPQMGESIAEGTITKWLKQVGDKIDKDEALLEISTDKVDTEIPSPAAGTLGRILVEEGQTVEVGTPLAVILAAGEKLEDAAIEAAPAATAHEEPAPAAAPAPEPAPAPQPVAAGAPASGVPRSADGRFYSPLVRSIATETSRERGPASHRLDRRERPRLWTGVSGKRHGALEFAILSLRGRASGQSARL